jgi:hypothetical protein
MEKKVTRHGTGSGPGGSGGCVKLLPPPLSLPTSAKRSTAAPLAPEAHLLDHAARRAGTMSGVSRERRALFVFCLGAFVFIAPSPPSPPSPPCLPSPPPPPPGAPGAARPKASTSTPSSLHPLKTPNRGSSSYESGSPRLGPYCSCCGGCGVLRVRSCGRISRGGDGGDGDGGVSRAADADTTTSLPPTRPRLRRRWVMGGVAAAGSTRSADIVFLVLSTQLRARALCFV